MVHVPGAILTNYPSMSTSREGKAVPNEYSKPDDDGGGVSLTSFSLRKILLVRGCAA
jgi:hypothetical protein